MIPVPLVHGPVQSMALAGDQVLVARAGRVNAFPGGRQVFTFTGDQLTLAASPVRVAARLEVGGSSQTLTGPPLGPWTALAPLSNDPIEFANELDGDRLFTSEYRPASEAVNVVVRDPDPHAVVFPPGAKPGGAHFAGELMAFADATALVVAEWRTGIVHNTIPLNSVLGSWDIRPDGRVAFNLDEGDGLYVAPPGQPAQRIANHAEATRFAGERIVFYDGSTLQALEPDGRMRALGVPTEQFGDLDADDQRVLWSANTCVLVANVTDPPAQAPAAGPCARSEIAVQRGTTKPGRTVRLRLRCVAAPKHCTGTVKLEKSGATRFTIPAGRARQVTIKLTRRIDQGYFTATARTDDGSRDADGITIR